MPLCPVGYLFRGLWRAGGRVLTVGVTLLLKIQPWFKADIQISVPRPSANRSGFITISNHRSHLDMFILLSKIPNLRAITKKALYAVPFLSLMLRVFRMIPVKRGDLDSYLHAMEVAKRRWPKEIRSTYFPR